VSRIAGRGLAALGSGLILFACGDAPVAQKELPPGGFRISALAADAAGAKRYLATAEETCRFEITIANVKSSGKSEFDFAFADGLLKRQAEADCFGFLKGIARSIGFRKALPSPPPEDELKVSFAILGSHLSRSTHNPNVAGGFSLKPPGDWTATKLFLADGEGEVFLNFSAKEGVGEFSYKDKDYADTVVTELAKVMLPRRRSS
jgi:hypothetical protein